MTNLDHFYRLAVEAEADGWSVRGYFPTGGYVVVRSSASKEEADQELRDLERVLMVRERQSVS